MCLAIPAKIVSLEADAMAVASFEGVKKRISLALVDDAAVGDYVLIHVGFALHKVSPEDAERTLALMAEAGILSDESDELVEPRP